MAEESNSCKVFVGGLAGETTKETLTEVFNKYGEIVDAVVMRDGATGRSRCFGFVTYSNSKALEDCLADEESHIVDGKHVDAKRAVPREESQSGGSSVATSSSSSTPSTVAIKKVFLGGLSLDTKEEDIRKVLETYGEVVNVELLEDKHTGKMRGFGFAIFSSAECVDELCRRRYIKIMERDVEVKKAIPQEEMRRRGGDNRGRSGGGGGGGGGGQGGYRNSRGYDHHDSYASSSYNRGGGMYVGGAYGDYRYPQDTSNYYPYHYDRNAAAYATYAGYGRAGGYDMSAAYGMYGTPAASMGAGAYGQTPSSYGPARGYATAPMGDGATGGGGSGGGNEYKDRGATGRQQNYHPYRRT